jgi:hypothetical protein
MTKFEDQLYQQLLTEHGHHLRGTPQPAPAPARRRAGRPLWLATGAAGAAAAITGAVLALGSAPAMAAYSVTHHNGTVTVAVNRSSGVAGANTTLHAIGAPVRVVPVGPGCPPIGSLPRPQPAPHLIAQVKTGISANGHRSVSVKVGNGGIPAGDTLILAFSGDQSTGSVGAGGVITGPVPSCVSLPAAPPPGVGSPIPAPSSSSGPSLHSSPGAKPGAGVSSSSS